MMKETISWNEVSNWTS